MHPTDFDGAARTTRTELLAYEFSVGNPLQLGVVGNAGRTIAKADLRPDIQGNLGTAIRGRTGKCPAGSPLVNWEWPFGLRPDRLDRLRCLLFCGHPHAHQNRRPQDEAFATDYPRDESFPLSTPYHPSFA